MNNTSFLFARRPFVLALPFVLLLASGSLKAATYTVTNTTDASTPGSLRNAFAEAGLSLASDTISFSSLFDTPQTITMGADFSPLIKTGIFTMAPSALLTVNSGNFSFLNLSGTTTYNVSNVNNQSTSASAIVVNNGAILSVSNFDFDNMTLAGGTFRNASTLTTTGTVALGSGGGTLDITSGTTTLLSTISGNSLTKAGAGVLTLSGSNSYNGNTTISAGTVHFSADANLGAASGTLTLNGGTLHNTTSIFDLERRINLGAGGGTIELGSGGLTLLNVVTGSGALTKTGGNILTLTGAQTYTGSTSVQGGTLKIEAGSLASSSVGIASGARLLFNQDGTYAGNIVGSGTFTRSGTGRTILSGAASHTGGTIIESGTLQIGNGTAGSLSGSGAIANAGALVFNSSATSNISGVISGTGGLTQRGGGLTVLSGSNTYTGGTRIAAGTLSISNSANLGEVSGALTLAGGTLRNTAALTLQQQVRLETNGNYIQTQTGDLTLGPLAGNGGFTKTGAYTLELTGANTYTGTTVIADGHLKLNDASTTAPTMDIRDSAGLVLSGTNAIYSDIIALGGINLTDGTTTIVGNLYLNPTTVPNDFSRWCHIGTNATLQLGDGVTNGHSIRGTYWAENSATLIVNTAEFNMGSGARFVFEFSSSLVKNGEGILTLEAASEFSDSFVILNEGTLALTHRYALGDDAGGTNAFLVINGGTLMPGSANFEIDLHNQVTINDDFNLGRFINLLGDITVTNDVTITLEEGDAFVPSANQARIGGNISGGAHSLTFDSVANPGAKIILSGSNSYSGGTKVIGGILAVENNHALGTGAVEVEGGIFLIESGFSVANDIVLARGTFQRKITGNLTHAVDATSDLGGRDTEAEILGGTSGTATTLITSFSGTSLALNDGLRISDVYSLEGTGTNTFVLQLGIDQVTSESYLGWLDPETNEWVNAVEGNTGGTMVFAGNGAYDPLTDFQLGTYGVDTANGTVWAVLNHNSEFAIIPEPGTCALIGLALAGLLFRRRRSIIFG